ncbi:MAG: hypothetical protein JNK57_19350 [Planctomycetaceae bacterium]|jgi:hypothetical protein|nr:hypothetical protein [Planctomycetaceae bacterium]
MRRLLTLGLVAMASVVMVGCGTDVAESDAPTPEVDKEAQKKSIDEMMERMKASAGNKGYNSIDSGKFVEESAKRNAEAPKE